MMTKTCHLLCAAPPSSFRRSTVEQQEAFNSSPSPPPATSALKQAVFISSLYIKSIAWHSYSQTFTSLDHIVESQNQNKNVF